MFKSARLKLTGWYLLIVMLVSIFFSSTIYLGTIREMERGFRRAEIRIRPGLPNPPSRFLFIEDLEIARRQVAFQLLWLNSLILVISAGAAYFLAGKTLSPIEEALEEQKRFVADASHELRTPLTALKTSMEVALRDKKITSLEAKKIIKSNLDDVDGLKSLSDNLLSLAHLQGNGKSLIFKEIDMTDLVEKVSKKLSPLAKEKKLELKVETKNQIIMASEEKLEEMLLIFLDNAIKYTPKGGEIKISGQPEKKWYVLEVKDTGVGISKEDLSHIFDRFYRADQSRSKNKVSGFGLGLSLAKKIIEIHKGSVEVLSQVNKGTTFIIRLPLLS